MHGSWWAECQSGSVQGGEYLLIDLFLSEKTVKKLTQVYIFPPSDDFFQIERASLFLFRNFEATISDRDFI